jgi:uncharacterized membrane protein
MMNKNRLEAFSDGVLAIIITIMVLELHVPEDATWAGLGGQLPAFLSYLLSFIYVGIYWTNHHHMMQLVDTIDGRILWANLHLLFWISIFPFSTHWMDESGFVQVPVLAYGANLLLAAVAYSILESVLIRRQGKDGLLALALKRDWKAKVSLAVYVAGIGLTFIHPLFGVAAFAVVAALWLVPDRRVERFLARNAEGAGGDPAK